MKQQDEMKIEALIYNYIDEFKKIFIKSKKESHLMDYSKNEVLALLFMYRKRVTNVSEIAEYIEAPLNTATGVINRLEKKKLVKRKRDEDDRRIVKIILTQSGEELCSYEKDIIQSNVRKALSALDEEEKASAYGIINKIIKSLNTQEEEPAEQKVVKKVKRITIEWL